MKPAKRTTKSSRPVQVPVVLPTAMPSRNLLATYTATSVNKDREHVVDVIRISALHEAAHAVFHDKVGSIKVERVALLPSPHVYVTGRVLMAREAVDAFVCGVLAGALANMMATPIGKATLSFLTYSSEGDLIEAVRLLKSSGVRPNDIERRIELLCLRTAAELKKPSVWRTIVTLADALIERPHLPIAQVKKIIATERCGTVVAGLDSAALRVAAMFVPKRMATEFLAAA